jgi:hypothetical protein
LCCKTVADEISAVVTGKAQTMAGETVSTDGKTRPRSNRTISDVRLFRRSLPEYCPAAMTIVYFLKYTYGMNILKTSNP